MPHDLPATLAHLDALNATLTAAEHAAELRDNPEPLWRYTDEQAAP